MSGPIVRKYGFPNFEKIFGERELQHGIDEEETPSAQAEESPGPAKAKTKKPAASKPRASKSKKSS